MRADLLREARKQLDEYVCPEPNTGCWLWGGSGADGYGVIALSGRKYQAHRVSWMVRRGPIKRGLVIRHLCNMRECVNPDHLAPGTHKENAGDRTKAGRWFGGPNQPDLCPSNMPREEWILREYRKWEIRIHKRMGLTRNGFSLDCSVPSIAEGFEKDTATKYDVARDVRDRVQRGYLPPLHYGWWLALSRYIAILESQVMNPS
jgi:hypothetical protein